MRLRTFALSLVAVAALQACGGGGGSATGGTQPGSFTLSATSAKFTAKRNGASSAAQVIHVHLLDNKTAAFGAAYVPPQTQPSWLNVSISGTAPDFDVTLKVTSTAQADGTQSATVTLGTADSAGNVLQTQAVQASLTILEPLSLDRTTIAGNYVLGQPVTSSASTVAITADPSTQWKLTTSVPWISASASSGTGSSSTSIQIDASGLTVGQSAGTVTITNTGDPTDTATISVNATVTAPTLAASPSAIVLGGSNGLMPGAQTLQISLGTGSNAYPWSASVATSVGGNWLKIGSASGSVSSAGTNISVDADYSLVSPGIYTGTVQIQATVKGVVLTQSVPITLNKEGHWLYVSAQGAAFSSFPSRSVLTRTLQVTSTQNRTDVPWTATADQSWLSVTGSGVTGGSLVLTANPAGLKPDQEYIANVTISSSDTSILNTQSVRVGLWVGSTDPGDATVSSSFPHIAANPVEPYVYASNGSSSVQVYQVYTGSLVRTLTTSLAQATEMVVSPDGTQLFVSDASNLEVVAIDPTTGATIRHFPWGSSSSGGLAYARPGAHPILLLGNGTIYNVSSGAKYKATFGAGWYGGTVSLAADASSKYVYAQDLGLSPSTLTQYALAYSALTADGLTVTLVTSTSGGSNGRDICVSADGSKVYSANGAPYDFPAFNSAGLKPAQTLPGTNYPNNAECGWNGLFVGGADAYYNATDVWVYRSDGTPVTTLRMHPGGSNDLLPNAVVLSGDNTRIIGSSSVPSLDFHSIPSP